MKRTTPFVIVLALACAAASCTTKNQAVDRFEVRIDSLLRIMTLDEKIGQTVLFTSDWDVTGPTVRGGYLEDIRSGRCGNIFNAHTVAFTRELQRTAVEESRLGIPLLFGYDVIHGHRTVFPVSLGEAASWDLVAIERSARVSAIEAASSGLHWTFAPMCDISVDPRWGRVSEGAGEDPYLGARVAEARVRGFQGDDISDTLTVAACVKHFAAYGAPLGGRDYNTVELSRRTFLDTYLPPYKAAIDAGAATVMTSFNDFEGVPASGSNYLLQELLRGELGFGGMIVSDYTSINEMVNHGFAEDDARAAELAFTAGVDMDMQGELYFKYLKSAVENGRISEERIDEAVRNVLRLKFSLGLFDDPYRYCDEERERRLVYAPEHLEAARDVAVRSMVLLKNDGDVLPLRANERLAVIGELAASKRDLLGSWKAAGDHDFILSILDGITASAPRGNVVYAEGCKMSGDDRSGFAAALTAARGADKVVMVIGENWEWTGEAASRTSLDVPGVQTELLERIAATGKPVVVVLLNGRPLTLPREVKAASAMLEAWYPGTMGGEAVADVLFGRCNPSGKLPMTFPLNVGQVPLFYYAKNTGRPDYLSDPKYKSKYIDSPNEPLFPFGYGLSYTTFEYSPITLSSNVLNTSGSLTASVTITNTGRMAGQEVVQMYVRDLVGSVTRPVRELKGFQKIALEAGESRTVNFEITPGMLAFHRGDMTLGVEPGDHHIFIGGNSRDVRQAAFTLK